VTIVAEVAGVDDGGRLYKVSGLPAAPLCSQVPSPGICSPPTDSTYLRPAVASPSHWASPTVLAPPPWPSLPLKKSPFLVPLASIFTAPRDLLSVPLPSQAAKEFGRTGYG